MRRTAAQTRSKRVSVCRNPFRIRTYEKTGGVGGAVALNYIFLEDDGRGGGNVKFGVFGAALTALPRDDSNCGGERVENQVPFIGLPEAPAGSGLMFSRRPYRPPEDGERQRRKE